MAQHVKIIAMMNKELDINPIIAKKWFCPPSTAAPWLPLIPVAAEAVPPAPRPDEPPVYRQKVHATYPENKPAARQARPTVPRIKDNSTQSGAESGTSCG